MEDVQETKSDDKTQPSFHSSDEEEIEPIDNEFIRDKLDETNMLKKSTQLIGRLQNAKHQLDLAKA